MEKACLNNECFSCFLVPTHHGDTYLVQSLFKVEFLKDVSEYLVVNEPSRRQNSQILYPPVFSLLLRFFDSIVIGKMSSFDKFS